MKYVIGGLAGLVCGAALALGLLYLNPLTQGAGGNLAGGPDWTFRYGYPSESSLLLTHGGLSVLPVLPPDSPRLWESTIRATSVNALVLADRGRGVSAAATRLSVPSAATDLLRSGAIVSDYWLVTVPGQGSFFVQSDNNLWPFLKEALLPVVLLDRPWAGPATYRPTVGPAPGRQAAVHGATGGFAARTGRGMEQYRVEGLSRAGGVEALAGELSVRLPPPETAPGTAASR